MITAFQESYYGNHSIIWSIFNLKSKLNNFEIFRCSWLSTAGFPIYFEVCKSLRQNGFNKVENIPFYYLTGTWLPRNVLPNELWKFLRQNSFNKVENIPFYYLTGTWLPRNVLPNEYHIYIYLSFLQRQLQDL